MNADKIITRPGAVAAEITAPKIKDIREEAQKANKLWTPSDFEAIDKLITKYAPMNDEKMK